MGKTKKEVNRDRTLIGTLIYCEDASLREQGKKMIEKAVKKAGSFVGAAKVLGVSERSMFRWVAKLGLQSPVNR